MIFSSDFSSEQRLALMKAPNLLALRNGSISLRILSDTMRSSLGVSITIQGQEAFLGAVVGVFLPIAIHRRYNNTLLLHSGAPGDRQGVKSESL
jgi:hypothetical protein